MGLWNWKRIISRRGGWSRARNLRLISVVALILLIAMLFSLIVLRAKAKPLVLPIFRSLAVSRIQLLVREVAEEITQQEEYQEICRFTYAADGTVQGLIVDSYSANQLVADLTHALRERLSKVTLTCKMQSGDVLFPKLFSGSGIPFTVRGSLYGGASAHLVSDLMEGGLNQTLHRLEVEVTVPVTLTVMGEVEEFSITSRILFGETVIVGAIPGGVVVG